MLYEYVWAQFGIMYQRLVYLRKSVSVIHHKYLHECAGRYVQFIRQHNILVVVVY